MVWYSHLFQNFPQLIVIHTVKGFGIVNKAEIDVFLELSSFFRVCVCVCSRVLLKCKRVEKAFDIDIKRGMESAPIASVIKALYTFPRPTPTTYILN